MTILVVDDEPLVRKMVASLLQDEGFAVFTAGCASEAIPLFASHLGAIDMLISDILMPGMDGTSLAMELKSCSPDLAVLLMSGNCDSSQIDNPFAFLPKPFSVRDLLAKVRRLLQSRYVDA